MDREVVLRQIRNRNSLRVSGSDAHRDIAFLLAEVAKLEGEIAASIPRKGATSEQCEQSDKATGSGK